MKSYMKNCFIWARKEKGFLFEFTKKKECIVKLNKYAIIPIEKYNNIFGFIEIWWKLKKEKKQKKDIQNVLKKRRFPKNPLR